VIPPPRWRAGQLERERLIAIQTFREERMTEPLAAYLNHYAQVRATADRLFQLTGDLLADSLRDHAVELMSDKDLAEAVRYLAGPPISADDLRVLAVAQFSHRALRADPEMARRVIDTVLIGLDERRVPWVAEKRAPTDAEREAALVSLAALVASRRTMTERAHVAKTNQENAVRDVLLDEGFTEADARNIPHPGYGPRPGEFCGESPLGGRKADIIACLLDRRLLAIECKVSNSSVNSVKRLNNDAAAKAQVWINKFGTEQIVPAAVLAGVFNRVNLEDAQNQNLTLFWSHDLTPLAQFIREAR
jgi:hypothetical protein